MNIEERWKQHKRALRSNTHHSNRLQNSWNKYGEEIFRFYVIEYVPNLKNLILKEQFYIDAYQSFKADRGYNISPTASSRLGLKHSKETIEKIRLSNKGQKRTIEARKNMSVARKKLNYRTIKETKEKIKLSNTGKKRSPESIERLRLSKRGSKNPSSILCEHLVKEIKLLLKLTDLKVSEIGKMYHVDYQVISDIRNNVTWNHVLIEDTDLLDWQLNYAIHQIKSERKRAFTINQYLKVIELMKANTPSKEIQQKTNLNKDQVGRIRRGDMSSDFKRELEFHFAQLEKPIVEDTSIYEWEDERVKKYYGI